MAKPTASFTFKASGLSVTFTDRSSGTIDSWLWDFGDGSSSSLQSPPAHEYAESGVYIVKLAVSNSDGTDIFQFSIVVTTTPNISLSILGLVQSETPPGIAVDGIVFMTAMQKWMLYLQQAFNISDEDVFNEITWPPKSRVLIAKLIIYELVVNAAQGAMIIFSNATQTYNQLAANIVDGSVMVADYESELIAGFTYPVVVNLIIINGVSFGPSDSLADDEALIDYLNSLDKGIFIKDGDSIKSLGNPNILTTFNYTHDGGGVNSSFTQSNARVINVTQSSSSSGSSTGQRGPLKRLETGPTVAEWYDSSEFWSNMFRPGGGGLANPTGGVLGAIQQDACMWASNLGIHLPFCQMRNTTIPVSVLRKRRRC